MSKLAGLSPEMTGIVELVAAVFVVVVFLSLCYFAVRSLFHRGVKVRGGPGRQQRLGAVDVFNLDQDRQLVLVRRDNVEHLVLIGGPNDVLIESQILRVEPRGGRDRDAGETVLQGTSNAPRIVAPGVALPVAPLMPVAPPMPAATTIPAAAPPTPAASLMPTAPQRPAPGNAPLRRDPPLASPNVPPPAATPPAEMPLVGLPADPTMALMAALGNALDLKEGGATPNPTPTPAPVVTPDREVVPPAASPPMLRAPLQRPVFERFASSPTRPPAPRPEPARAVPSLATMSARQLPQPAPKAEVLPPHEPAAANQNSGGAPTLTSPLSRLLGNLPKAGAGPTPVSESVAAPLVPPQSESGPTDSLEKEMAMLLGRPSNGA